MNRSIKCNTTDTQGFDALCGKSPTRLKSLRSQLGTEWRATESRCRVRALIATTEYPQACMGFNEPNDPVIVAFDPTGLPVRQVEFADVDHDGWFADSEGLGDRGVIRGVIATLSHGRMLAGYHGTDAGDWVLYCNRVYSDASEAGAMADEHARVYAEAEQAQDALFRAMTDAESIVEDHERDVQDAIAARNTSTRNRQWARDAIERLRQSREELKTATEAYES